MSSGWTPLVIAGILGAGGALILLVRSVLVFSRTGPRIRDEIRRHFYSYTVFALVRLVVWSGAVIAWMAALGMLPVAALYSGWGQPPTIVALAGAAVLGIVLITAVQFCSHLLHIPSSIMMSSHYSMSRFYGPWARLSVSRIRWARVGVGLLILGPVTVAAHRLFAAGRVREGLALVGVTGILLVPVLYGAWPPGRGWGRRRRAAGAGKRPNILMIGCDTLRADRLGIGGYSRDTTPFLDVLARRGTFFGNCYTPIARTAPSLASLLTGVWPHAHGIRSNYVAESEADLPVPALGTLLREQGYRTVALGDWAGSDLRKLAFGFEHTELPEDQWNIRYLIRQGPKDIRLFLSLFSHNRLGKRFLPELYYLAGVPLTDHLGHDTRSWLSRFAGSGEPFFMNVFMATAHPPFGSEYPYYKYFSDPDYCGPSKFAMAKLADPEDIIRSQKAPREAFDLDQVIDLYDGCVRRFDDEVRAIVQHLENCGLDEQTIVVIYSDHGMEFFEHNTWGQGNSVRGDASAKVPLILVDPGKPGRGVDDRVVRTVDLAPTLLDLCNAPIPAHMQGRSLASYLHGDSADLDLPAFFETGIWLAPPPGMDPDHVRYPELLDLLEVPDKQLGTLAIKQKYRPIIEEARDRTIRHGRWKLVRLSLVRGPRYELYDAWSDPGYTTDVADQYPAVAGALKRELEAWLAAETGREGAGGVDFPAAAAGRATARGVEP